MQHTVTADAPLVQESTGTLALPAVETDMTQAVLDAQLRLKQLKAQFAQSLPANQGWFSYMFSAPADCWRNAWHRPGSSATLQRHLMTLDRKAENLYWEAKQGNMEAYLHRQHLFQQAFVELSAEVRAFKTLQQHTIAWVQGAVIGGLSAITANPHWDITTNLLIGVLTGVLAQVTMDLLDKTSMGKRLGMMALMHAVCSGAMTGAVTGVAGGLIKAFF